MYRILSLAFLAGIIQASCPEILDSDVKILNKKEYKNLCEYSGKTILVVNTASKCGFTYQYEQLEDMYREYGSENFMVLAFPSRDFLYQEFSDEEAVEEFCSTNYEITFPMFSITKVNASRTHPFYEKLFKATNERPRWNFHKYLIKKDGSVESFSHRLDPKDKQILSSIQDSLSS